MTELTILMPCLNEAETLDTCIRKAKGYLDRAESGGFCEARHDIGQGRDVAGASPKLD